LKTVIEAVAVAFAARASSQIQFSISHLSR